MKKFFLMATGLLLFLNAGAVEPEQKDVNLTGSGTKDDPWQITKKEDILEIAKWTSDPDYKANFAGKYFEMKNDIDMSGVTDFYGIGAAPMTQNSATGYNFSGTFDGKGFRIKNLKIDGVKILDSGLVNTAVTAGNSRNYVGLFGVLNGAAIRNVVIDKSCSFRGYGYVAPFGGYITAASVISNCVNEADIYSYNGYAAGIAAYMFNSSSNLNSNVKTVITDCVNYGNIYSAGSYAAGIFAYSYYMGDIRNCANYGTINSGPFDEHAAKGPSEATYAAGIIAYANCCKIENCVNGGTIIGVNDFCGGIAGNSFVSSSQTYGGITNCVNYGQVVTPSKIAGAIVGRNGSGTSLSTPFVITNSYYDSQICGLSGKGCGEGTEDGITAKTTAELTNGTALSGLDASLWSFTNNFYPMMASTKNNDWAKFGAGAYLKLPNNVTSANFSGTATASTGVTGLTLKSSSDLLKVTGTSVTIGTSALGDGVITISKDTYSKDITLRVIPTTLFTGAGTAASPYLIKTVTDLETLGKSMTLLEEHYKGKYFRLENNLDLKGSDFTGIGCGGGSSPYNKYYFSGTFDGNGKTISNYEIRKGLKNAAGSTIYVSAGSWESVGFFGTLDTTAVVKNLILDESCYIGGYQFVGGIAGRAFPGALVENCEFRGTVYSINGSIGGIVGFSGLTSKTVGATWQSEILGVKDCFFAGTINSQYSNVGGIVGELFTKVEGCLSAGYITFSGTLNNQYCGGIAGYNGGQIFDCVNFSTIVKYTNYTGGIAGTNNGYYGGCGIQRALNAGLIMSTAASAAEIVAQFQNNTETVEGNKVIPEIKTVRTVYADMQLAFSDKILGSTVFTNKFIDSTAYHEMTTADLTNGEAIDSLPNFYFEKGYYPIPKALKDNKLAKQRAAVYMTFPEGQSLKDIRTGADINTTVDLSPKMAVGTIFKIADNRLYYVSSDSVAIDTVILTTGDFQKKYPVTMMAAFLKGTGTQQDPWQVATVSDMNKIADYVTVSKATFDGEYFKLLDDIDYEGGMNKVIGNSSYRFNGIFDGDNHTIKNIVVNTDNGVLYSNRGIFGYVGQQGAVKNLKLSNVNLKCGGYSGLVAGYLYGTMENVSTDEKCSIEGVYVDEGSNQRSARYLGGLIGYLLRYATVKNCVNKATVTGNEWIGGIVGNGENMADGVTRFLMENCDNYGDITSFAEFPILSDGKVPAAANAGGICGSSGGRLVNCNNYGNVKSIKEGYYVGGITGYASIGLQLENCHNYGDISTVRDYAGGLIGWSPTSSWLDHTSSITDCSNEGTITARNFAGGLIGQASTRMSVENSFNNGKVVATHRGGGGLIAVVRGVAGQSFSLENSFNAANVTGEIRVAGLVGYAEQNGTNTINKCFNVGNVYETIRVDSVNCAASGIANGAITVQNSYNAGDVAGWNNVGGIIGAYLAPATGLNRLAGVYSIGKVSSPRTAANTKIGNISSSSSSVAALCYALSTNQKFANDDAMGVTMVTPIELTTATLPAAFVKNELCFPMIGGLDNTAPAKANAAYFDGTTDEDGCFNADINLASLDGIEWDSNHLISVEGNTGKTAGSGVARLTAICGDFSKDHFVKVDTYNSVGQLFNDLDDVIEKQFFTLDGIRLAEPRVGAVNVVVYITKDGKKEVKKVYIKE